MSCEHKPAGYQISITNYLPAGSMAVGADSYAFRERSPEAYFALWLAGTILTGIAFVLLPMMLPGKIHMNGYLVCILTVSPQHKFSSVLYKRTLHLHSPSWQIFYSSLVQFSPLSTRWNWPRITLSIRACV